MHSILAVTDAPFTQAPALLFFHLLGLILYLGGFLALSRWLAKAVRFESADARTEAYRVLKRMHKFVDWPGLGMAVLTGLYMLMVGNKHQGYMKAGYFHIKLTCVIALIVCDVIVTRKLFALKGDGEQPSATAFRVIHGVAGLALIGILAAMTFGRA